MAVRPPQPSERLWTVQKAGREVSCELRDLGEAGAVEMRLFRDGEFYAGRRFDTRARGIRYADGRRGQFAPLGWRLE